MTVLVPDWERVRNRPQRNPLHTFTVDRHLVEAAAYAAAMTRDVARPDLLLVAALLHDIGKGWPGDHSVSGEVVARDVARRIGFCEADAELVAQAVRRRAERAPRVKLEASGNVKLATVRALAQTGVDRISVGALLPAPDLDSLPSSSSGDEPASANRAVRPVGESGGGT